MLITDCMVGKGWQKYNSNSSSSSSSSIVEEVVVEDVVVGIVAVQVYS
jgi:hypothetical protein